MKERESSRHKQQTSPTHATFTTKRLIGQMDRVTPVSRDLAKDAERCFTTRQTDDSKMRIFFFKSNNKLTCCPHCRFSNPGRNLVQGCDAIWANAQGIFELERKIGAKIVQPIFNKYLGYVAQTSVVTVCCRNICLLPIRSPHLYPWFLEHFPFNTIEVQHLISLIRLYWRRRPNGDEQETHPCHILRQCWVSS